MAKEERVTILYACETGSRAWGFASQDSDYDVRFIYLRPTAWYLTVQDKRDVIERPVVDNLDITGWDLRKALQLLRKSNPPLLEWLQSPIVYRETSSMRRQLGSLMKKYYSPISCMYHYLHMAEGNFRQYLKGKIVWTKKYFYVLRPVLACIWIEQGYGVVPIEFNKLMSRTINNERLRVEINTLLECKKSGNELDRGPRNKILSEFLEKNLKRFRANVQPPPSTRDPERLDRLFRNILKEVNGTSIEQSHRQRMFR